MSPNTKAFDSAL